MAFPTETVYGLGGGIMHEEALRNIYMAKGRPQDNPLIVHIACKDDIKNVAKELTESAKILADAFMPGAITLVVKRRDDISAVVSAGLDTVAVRCPSHKIAHALIEAAEEPIAAPSANLSGKPSPTIARHVIEDLNGRVDAIISGGECLAGVESTVVDVTGDTPVILRPGIITYEDISEYIPSVCIDKHVLSKVEMNEVPKSPGMKYKHYAPNADVTVVEGDAESVKRKINELIKNESNLRVGVIAYMNKDYIADKVIYAGNNSREYAHNLFTVLRSFDESGIDKVFAEFHEEGGCAMAVKNRLYKSAGYKVIHV